MMCCMGDSDRRDFDDLRRVVASWRTRGDILTEPLYHRHENARFCTFNTFQLEDRYLTVQPRWCTYSRPTMNSAQDPLMNSTLTPRVGAYWHVTTSIHVPRRVVQNVLCDWIILVYIQKPPHSLHYSFTGTNMRSK
jgi:hypothetical protein